MSSARLSGWLASLVAALHASFVVAAALSWLGCSPTRVLHALLQALPVLLALSVCRAGSWWASAVLACLVVVPCGVCATAGCLWRAFVPPVPSCFAPSGVLFSDSAPAPGERAPHAAASVC